MVLDGVLDRNTSVRLIRDGVVVYTGELSSLKRFKDDVNEVKNGNECGMELRIIRILNQATKLRFLIEKKRHKKFKIYDL